MSSESELDGPRLHQYWSSTISDGEFGFGSINRRLPQGAFAPRLWAYELRISILIGCRRNWITMNQADEFLIAVRDLDTRFGDPVDYDAVLTLASFQWCQ